MYQPLDSKQITIVQFPSSAITIVKKQACKMSKANVVYKKEIAEVNCLSQQVPIHIAKDPLAICREI